MLEGFFTTVIFETAVLLAGYHPEAVRTAILAHRLYISPAFPAVPEMVNDFVSRLEAASSEFAKAALLFVSQKHFQFHRTGW